MDDGAGSGGASVAVVVSDGRGLTFGGPLCISGGLDAVAEGGEEVSAERKTMVSGRFTAASLIKFMTRV